MFKKPYLSVIIPCYNEEANLKRGVLNEVEDYLRKQEYESEIIISDDGSIDKSRQIIRKFVQDNPRFKLLENPHAGKPFAIKSGIEKAGGEIILFTDMDQSTPISEFRKILPYFKKGLDIAIGSRGRGRQGSSFLRLLASNIFRVTRQLILLRKIVDTQCGFKAFKNEVAKGLFPRMEIFSRGKQAVGWRVSAFDVELLFIAQKRGYKIAEVSVKWRDKDVTQGKQRKFLKESQEMLKEILRVKLNDIRGFYD